MKFLKEYKVFESHSKIVDDARDALRELSDNRYGISVQVCDTHVDVKILSPSESMGEDSVRTRGFVWSEIKENVEFLINYIKHEWYLYKIKIDTEGLDFPEFQTFENINDMESYLKDKGSKQDYPVVLDELSMRFKKEKTQ